MPNARRKALQPEPRHGRRQPFQPRSPAGLFRYGAVVGLLLLLVWAPQASAWQCEARIERVHDGDTLSLRCPERRFKLRLHGVDAPELSQPSGQRARTALQRYLSGRELQVSSRATDVYGRVIGAATVEGESVAAWLVESGWAWCAPRARAECRQRQAAAQAARHGLWKDEGAVAPWVWREQQAPHSKARPDHGR